MLNFTSYNLWVDNVVYDLDCFDSIAINKQLEAYVTVEDNVIETTVCENSIIDFSVSDYSILYTYADGLVLKYKDTVLDFESVEITPYSINITPEYVFRIYEMVECLGLRLVETCSNCPWELQVYRGEDYLGTIKYENNYVRSSTSKFFIYKGYAHLIDKAMQECVLSLL